MKTIPPVPRFRCKCAELTKPAPMRNWVCYAYHMHASAFNGVRWSWTKESTVKCLSCGAYGRTSGLFVDHIRRGQNA